MQTSDIDVLKWMLCKARGGRSVHSPVLIGGYSNTPILGPRILITDGHSVLQHVGDIAGVVCDISNCTVPERVELLIASYYAFGLTYPRSYASFLSFLQQTCLQPVKEFSLPPKILKLATDYCCI
jgi:hypothetical protein